METEVECLGCRHSMRGNKKSELQNIEFVLYKKHWETLLKSEKEKQVPEKWWIQTAMKRDLLHGYSWLSWHCLCSWRTEKKINQKNSREIEIMLQEQRSEWNLRFTWTNELSEKIPSVLLACTHIHSYFFTGRLQTQRVPLFSLPPLYCCDNPGCYQDGGSREITRFHSDSALNTC